MNAIAELAASFAPCTGRAREAARVTMVVSLVMLLELWLELPGIDLAAYVVLFTSRRSAAATARLGLVFAVLAPVAALLSLVLWGVSADQPMLRVILFALLTWVAMYVKELPGKGAPLYALGMLTVCFSVVAARASDGDLLTRTILKVAFAVSIAGCASAFLAGLLWPNENPATRAEAKRAPDTATRRSFALRVTVATMLGYLAWELTDWYGIHTCMFTALFIASSDTAEVTLRGRLRMAGAIFGSVVALLAIVFVVPALDTVAGLIVLAAPVTFLAAWIAAGPERFGYLGLQIGFAFYLALLGRSGPTTDLHEARDRIVGVLLGVVLVVLALEGLVPRGRKALPAVTGGN